MTVDSGVSKKLAAIRKKTLSDVHYDLEFFIPDTLSETVAGFGRVRFLLKQISCPLILDFAARPEQVKSVAIENELVDYRLENEHIVVPAKYLKKGENEIRLEFIAGDSSLNRSQKFLYTLFVPDRARTVFPCFDQPDLKARFRLSLEAPNSWSAMANSKIEEITVDKARKTYRFCESELITTYLFSFVVGEFSKVTRSEDGREITLYHRETDIQKIERNVERIFALAFLSLRRLEEYTGIVYPFPKLDMAAIPSFQYGGMEHPGAILYRASRIFLDESATLEQRLARANLIAHETAHMWFGGLVTIKWFDEVWLKEVFANFIADKITPSFPETNHRLRFLLRHYPQAYSIDRSQGTHPIEQKLDNLKDAGSIYGKIIYHKAPIVMAHMERITGEEKLREGLNEYLSEFSYDNADWNDLIAILDRKTDFDLRAWSATWILEAGMPCVSTDLTLDPAGNVSDLFISQSDPSGRKRFWPQILEARIFYEEAVSVLVQLGDRPFSLGEARGKIAPKLVLADTSGLGYGYFALGDSDIAYLLKHMAKIDDRSGLQTALTRGIAWLNLWENMLNERITPSNLLIAMNHSLECELNSLIFQFLLNCQNTLFWSYLRVGEQREHAFRIEEALWRLTNKCEKETASACFLAYRQMAFSLDATENLIKIWEEEVEIPISLSENQRTDLAFEIAVRNVPKSREILERQLKNIRNPDMKARGQFIAPALAPDRAERDHFFHSLKNRKNREREPWVLTGLYYLHHPLRAKESKDYILPALEMLDEIQSTGDIFFPIGWLTATLHGHNTKSAARIVRKFLQKRPDYPLALKLKILQAADQLFHAAKIVG